MKRIAEDCGQDEKGDKQPKLEDFKPVGKCPFAPGPHPRASLPNKQSDVNYQGYLALDTILNAQHPRSAAKGSGTVAHDEMLFIVIHQTYELWFKQLIWELDSVNKLFAETVLSNAGLCVAVQRLSRVVEIQKVLVEQLRILETMTPLSFLEFRDLLGTSSGFQSFQFRMLEIKLGLRREQRMRYNGKDFEQSLTTPQQAEVASLETEKSLFENIDRWLARHPFLAHKEFDFWEEYKASTRSMFQADRLRITQDVSLSSQEQKEMLEPVEGTSANFEILFDERKYTALLTAGKKRLSYKALKAAILIKCFQEEPLFQMPHALLELVVDIDANMRTWRYRHAVMVHRMLGLKVGTGGSSGYHYLRATANEHQIFSDFFDLSMFLVPRTCLPVLPAVVKKHFGFFFDNVGDEQTKNSSPVPSE